MIGQSNFLYQILLSDILSLFDPRLMAMSINENFNMVMRVIADERWWMIYIYTNMKSVGEL